jgi:hypothetical protein
MTLGDEGRRQMKRPVNGFARGLVTGTLIGLILGSSAVSLAEFKKSGWERFNGMFRAGYIAGFNDAVRIAKYRSAGSYLDTAFSVPSDARVSDWLKAMNRLYAKKENENLAVSQIIQLAGKELEGEFGADVSADNLARLAAFIQQRRDSAAERVRRKKIEEERAEAAGIEKPDPSQHPKVKMMKARRETLAMLGIEEDYWEDTGARLKRGYVEGFNDCVYVARLTDGDGFVAKSYALPKANFQQWRRALNGFYGEIARQAEPRLVAMAHAGRAVAAKHGTVAPADEKTLATRREFVERKLAPGAFAEKPAEE